VIIVCKSVCIEGRVCKPSLTLSNARKGGVYLWSTYQSISGPDKGRRETWSMEWGESRWSLLWTSIQLLSFCLHHTYAV
jgi:hypothetical protein